MIAHSGCNRCWLAADGQPDFVLNDTCIRYTPGHNHQCYRIKPHEQLVSVSLTHLRFHTRPINVLVLNDSLGDQVPGYLIFRRVSRLDAFSGYLFRT